MLISVVIRTFNEERYLGRLLQGIAEQELAPGDETEVVLVDSGSTDETVAIARNHNAHIENILKEEFTFGRSLNRGFRRARGEVVVMVSGHCFPHDKHWIARLVAPIKDAVCVYSYGKQTGDAGSHFSETQIFKKYFPDGSRLPQQGFFCNNANSALLREVWSIYPFDEELPGLEDMAMAKRLLEAGHRIAYVAEAPVYHLHHETLSQIKRRYEREAIALQHIMPEVQISALDFFRYWGSAILHDSGAALEQRQFWSQIGNIVTFRFSQFLGSYRGNHIHRKLSRESKELYFYPRRLGNETKTKVSRTPSHEGQQRTSAGQELPRIGR